MSEAAPVGGQAVDTHQGQILYVEGVTVSFDGFKALDDLNLYLEDGELRCLIGPNGAGKTTLMDVITGKTRPDTGKVFFGSNIDLTALREHEIARAGDPAASSRSRRCSRSTTCSPTSSSPRRAARACWRR